MISNPNLLSYTCIAKGTIVLAEFVSKEDPGIEAVASRCIENTPLHHSTFSHTVDKKTYTFEIDDDSFVYFAILNEGMEKHESLWVLNRLRSAIEDLIRERGSDSINPDPYCLQSKLDPVFEEMFGVVDVNLVESPRKESHNPSIDSSKGRRVALIPLLGKPLKAFKKKKKNRLLQNEEDSGDINDHHQMQKAKQIWKKHVWMVLLFDFCICGILFGIWLWICQGFQCIQR